MKIEKEFYEDVFVVLTYRNTKDIEEFISSVKKSVKNYRIVIVNSFYDEITNEEIHKIALDNGCDFLSVENKGYGCGNNRGIEYAMCKFEFKRLVVSNPDIIINEYNQDVLGKITEGIIGGKIRNLKGKKQNPLRVYQSWITDNAAYNYYCKKNKFLFLLGVLLAKIFRTAFSFFAGKRIKKVYAIHGSFIIFTSETLKKICPVFDENIFMFCEELDLAARFKKNRVPTWYTSQVVVFHKEDGSINVSNLDVKEKMRISCEYVYNKHWGNSL